MLMIEQNLRSEVSMCLFADDVAIPCIAKIRSRSKERNYEAFRNAQTSPPDLSDSLSKLDPAPRLQPNLKRSLIMAIKKLLKILLRKIGSVLPAKVLEDAGIHRSSPHQLHEGLP